MKASSWPAGWLTVFSVGAVLGVNAAGIWGIAAARRGARETAARLFGIETEARARALESALSATRADLAFLAGSSAVSRLADVRPYGERDEARWRRLAAEATLLVFLRGHPEVGRLIVKAGKDESIIEVARRGGVPILWVSPDDAAEAVEPRQPLARPVRAVFAFDTAGPHASSAVRLVAEMDAGALLEAVGAGRFSAEACTLTDARGEPVTAPPSPGGALPATAVADAPVRVDGWSTPSPWRLSCRQRNDAAESLLEPMARRGRTTLALNAVVMGLAAMLGFFAVQQARRRERLEAEAREEARVRELERQLFHAERLSTVGRLAAGMAHELNNPLEGMTNYLALAKDLLARNDATGARAHLESLRQGLERVAAVVRQVLAQANPAATPRSRLELGAVIRQTAEFVRTRPEFRGIVFRLELSGDPLSVEGSEVALGQVFLNLLVNACEAQPGGGEVEVRAIGGEGHVRVEVADRGPGIPEAERARIFEPFYSTKRSTGLGLSVCHAIVREHGGRLEAGPRPGGGALFTLELPSARGREVSA